MNTNSILADHVDVRPIATDEGPVLDRNAIVQLDPDHPGFRDLAYRMRRNAIAEIALSYEPGTRIPDASYTEEEHEVWQTIWEALTPAHQQYACGEYLAALKRLEFVH